MRHGFLCTFFQKYWNRKECFVAFLCLGSCFCCWAVLSLGIIRGPIFLCSFYLAFSSSRFLCPFGDLVHQSVWYPSCCHLSAFLQFAFIVLYTCLRMCLFLIFCHSLCESPPCLSGPTGNTFAVCYWRIHKNPKLLQQWYSYFPSFSNILWKRILKKYDLPHTLLCYL